MKNGQKELFIIKWKNFSHSESTWEPKENISPKTIIKSYFKESSDKGTHCHINVCCSVQFSGQLDHSLKIFPDWEILCKSLLIWFVLIVMFTYANVAPSVNPDLTAQKSLLWEYLTIQQMNYDYNMSRYVKITLTCNYKNIFCKSLKARQETEQLVSPKNRLIAVKNRTILTTIGIRHLGQS